MNHSLQTFNLVNEAVDPIKTKYVCRASWSPQCTLSTISTFYRNNNKNLSDQNNMERGESDMLKCQKQDQISDGITCTRSHNREK